MTVANIGAIRVLGIKYALLEVPKMPSSPVDQGLFKCIL